MGAPWPTHEIIRPSVKMELLLVYGLFLFYFGFAVLLVGLVIVKGLVGLLRRE